MVDLFRPGYRSYLLVVVQFLCLGGILVTGPLIPESRVWQVVAVFGVSLGCSAFWVMQLRNFHVMPDVKAGSRLVTRGPYRIIRHPMYLAVLLVALAIVVDTAIWWRVLLWLVLLLDLHFKMSFEESLLLERFPEYAEYQAQTNRLIPRIY